MLYELNGVEVAYLKAHEGQVAVTDIDLSMHAGEFTSIIGPSGCGKSTLLHCMGGLLAPTGGSVLFEGTPLRRPDPAAAAFVFQDYSLLPWKTAAENVALGLRFAGERKAERREKAMECLGRLGLGDVADSYPSELSGGMQQRVAVARAMAMEPRVLLMDEPFGALDEQTRRLIGADMSVLLARAGKTVVMVTHSLDEAVFWADRVLVMGETPGRIIAEFTVDAPRPRDVAFLADPGFVEVRERLLDLLMPSFEQHSSAKERA